MFVAHDAAHLAIVDAEASEQVDRAIAGILELASGGPSVGRSPTRLRRLVWRGWLAHADARFLIDTEQGTIRGRVEQQLDDGHGFGGELGITVIHPRAKDGPGGPGAVSARRRWCSCWDARGRARGERPRTEPGP